MSLEEQYVVSRELAEKMKELGFEQRSYFVWHERTKSVYPLLEAVVKFRKEHDQLYSAYTAVELGEMLPSAIEKNDLYFELNIVKGEDKWIVYYEDHDEILHVLDSEKMTNAMAKMLIYLKINKLI